MENKSVLDLVLLNETLFADDQTWGVIMRENDEHIGDIVQKGSSFVASTLNGKRTFPCPTKEFAVTSLIGLHKKAKSNLKKNKKNIDLKQEDLFA